MLRYSLEDLGHIFYDSSYLLWADRVRKFVLIVEFDLLEARTNQKIITLFSMRIGNNLVSFSMINKNGKTLLFFTKPCIILVGIDRR